MKSSLLVDFFFCGGGEIFSVMNLIALIVIELLKLSVSYWVSCGSLFFEEAVYLSVIKFVYGVHGMLLLSF